MDEDIITEGEMKALLADVTEIEVIKWNGVVVKPDELLKEKPEKKADDFFKH